MIKRLIESDDFIIIDELSEELGISRGTAVRDIKELKEQVKYFDVEVKGTPNRGMHIYGEEFNLRLLYIYQVQDYFPDNLLVSETTEIIDQLTQLYQVPKIYASLLKKTICTVITRINQNQLLKKMPVEYFNCINASEIDALIYHLELRYCITLSQAEREFICFPLELSANKLKCLQKENEEKLQYYFQKILVAIHKILIVDFDEISLFNDMKYHLMYLINRLLFRFETQDLFYGEIEKQYPFAYELAKVGMSELEKVLNCKSSSVEISYLALYFELALRKQTDHSLQKEIAIVCSTGKGTALIIQRQIEKVIGPDIKITHYSEEEYKNKDLSQFFAIFTTIPLENMDTLTPVIRLSHLFNTEWLRDEWEKAYELQTQNIKKTDFRFSILDNCHSYDENLVTMMQPLKSEELVDRQFIERIFDRERKSSTIYESGIALPHAINQASDRIIFSLGIFPKKALQTKVGKLDFILLLAIPESLTLKDEEELLRLYDLIFSVAGDTQLKNELFQLKNQQELTNWVERKFIS